MLNGIDMAFKKWWSSLLYDHTVNVRFPYSQHGLCSWTSNSAKVEAKEAFLQFVDDNSQPNGRRMDSQSPTHYLLPQFKTISTPKNTLASKWIKPWCWLWAMKWVNNWAKTLFKYAISRSSSCRISRSKTADTYFEKDMPSFINLNSVDPIGRGV